MVRTLQGHCSSSFQVRISSILILDRYQLLTWWHDRFSDEFTSAYFAKIDVDEVPDVAQELGIRAMPTFLIFKGEEKIAEVVGANPKALLAAIQDATKEAKI